MVALLTGILLVANVGGAIGSPGVEALFFRRYGVEFLPTMYIILGLVTPATSLTMSAIMPRVRPERFFTVLPVGMIAFLLGFRALLLTGADLSYPVLWLGMNTMWTLQGLFVWGSAGLVTNTRQAKRLFPLFVVGGILGMTAGGFLTPLAVTLIGAENLIVIWAAGLSVSFILVSQLLATCRTYASFRTGRRPLTVVDELRQGLAYIRSTDLLRWIGLAAVFFAVLFYSLTFPYARSVSEQFPNENDVATFLGTLSGIISGTAMLASLFLANRLYARVGFMAIILSFPLLYFAGFTVAALVPTFMVLVAFRFAQMFWLYGLTNGAIQAMFNVVPPDHREQSRTFIQGVANPLGISLAGVTLMLGDRLLNERGLFVVGAIIAAWVSYLVWQARRAYGSALIAALRAGHAHIFFSREQPFGGFRLDSNAVATALKGVANPDVVVRRIAADILGQLSLPEATDTLVRALSDEDASVRVALLRALGRSGASEALLEAAACLRDRDAEVRRQAIETINQLTDYPTGIIGHVEPMLSDPEPSVRIKAAATLLRIGEHEQAEELLLQLASAACYTGDQIAKRIDALEALADWGDPRALPLLEEGLRDPVPAIRRVSAKVIGRVNASLALHLLVDALADDDSAVREAAALALGEAGHPALDPALESLADHDKEEGALLALEHLPVRQASDRIQGYAVEQRDRSLHYQGLWLGCRSTMRELTEADDCGANQEEAGRLVADSLQDKTLLHGIHAIRAVGLLGPTEAIKLAIEELTSKDGAQQANAIETLEWLGEPAIVRPLIPLWEENDDSGQENPNWLPPMLGDDDPWIRACGALAARYVGPQPVVNRLQDLAQDDPDEMVRECALSALNLGESMETLSSLSIMERILFLRRVPLFADLAPRDLKQIAIVAGEEHFSPGTVIARQGERGDVMHIIVEGEVGVTVQLDDGSAAELAVRGPGEYVGEMAMISEEERMATLTAIGDARTLNINQDQFEETLRLRPETSLALMRVLCQRLREQASDRIGDVL